ncbi:MAG: Daunorubicin/doxorubicin resistance ATP-binding protein DrrA [Verrucomicrobia bacterium ADurb.Bin474]|nr:MAG: Daunorubicin/doxorubicin resistance ATP-binding protein DrrA [Verrucomicrobia bacterium ADurb.Bin474]
MDGIDAVANPEAARARSGFLTGSSGLYDRLSGRETLSYFGSLNGMDREGIRSRTAELARSLGFESYLDRRVGRYSTGMKQKLSIARTVLHDPQVMLFDEPTSGLDVIGAKAIMDWIRRSRDGGKTVLFSTHRMDEVALIAQDLAIIHEGRLCYNGTLDGFMESYPGRSLEQAFLDALAPSSGSEEPS